MLAVLAFLPRVNNKILFCFLAVIATYIPDIDSEFSKAGRYTFSRIIQFFSKHRGVLHSFSLCFLISLILALFIPKMALPFFIGYSLHLFADSFTFQGITPFWPYKKESSGFIRTGSSAETTIFIFFILLDLWMFIFFARSLI
ncbi:metal-dependent hydrolase [Candidatus Pacearchaeota archaeon]|nr:metal-dependent hydrolase [Candidatus Pacearchaeota archaeon]